MRDDSKRNEIREIGEAFFGERWMVPLAEKIGVTPQHLGGIMAGKYQVSDTIGTRVLEWVQRHGIPEMKERYKALCARRAALAILMVDLDHDLDMDLERDGPEMR
jgi:hypothetical protein